MTLLDRSIGRNLQSLRRRKGLTRGQLSASLGASVAEIVDFEAGRRRIGPRRLAHLSELLDCPLSCFFAGGNGRDPGQEPPMIYGLEDQIRAQALVLARAYYRMGDFRSRTGTAVALKFA